MSNSGGCGAKCCSLAWVWGKQDRYESLQCIICDLLRFKTKTFQLHGCVRVYSEHIRQPLSNRCFLLKFLLSLEFIQSLLTALLLLCSSFPRCLSLFPPIRSFLRMSSYVARLSACAWLRYIQHTLDTRALTNMTNEFQLQFCIQHCTAEGISQNSSVSNGVRFSRYNQILINCNLWSEQLQKHSHDSLLTEIGAML